jgi:subtilisin family serine protease
MMLSDRAHYNFFGDKMKIRFLFALLLLPLISLQVSADTGRHLVMLKGNAKNFERSVKALGGSVFYRHDATGIAVVDGLDEAGAAALEASKSVANVTPDFAIEMPKQELGGMLNDAFTMPDNNEDPTQAGRWAWQWNMRAVDADDAWAMGRLGSPDVTVAILDTGIAYTHADLEGLVDLDRSVSFVPEDDALVDLVFPGMHHITDIHYHGTHVAATVASNAIAAAGVTSKTTLMGVKVCSAVLGYCPGSAVIPGVLEAADAGADVANMSLGGSFAKSEYPGSAGYFNKIFNYAKSKGMTIVVSAGNSGFDLDHDGDGYKTYCSTPATICVSATGPDSTDDIYEGPFYNVDAPAYYTNYCRSAINVAAPGGNSGGYVWAACSNTSLDIPGCQAADTFIVGLGGTSMASPHVAGLAALMVEDYGRNPGAVKTAIQNSADDLGQSGTDPFYGKGRINVNNAVQ